MEKILVAGGTGMLGRAVVRELLQNGFAVRVLSRDAESVKKLFGDTVECATADVSRSAGLREAMKGCAGLHISLMGGPSRADYIRVEVNGVQKLLDAAQFAGVQKVTYLSGMAVSNISESQADDPKFPDFSAGAKFHAEKLIRESGLPYIIFRPTSFLETFSKYVRSGTAWIPGNFRPEYHWLCSTDLAHYVSRAFLQTEIQNKTLHLLGKQKLGFNHACDLFYSTAMPGTKIRNMKTGMLRILAIFVPALRSGLRMMALALSYQEFDDQLTRELLGDFHTPPDECVKIFLRNNS